MELNTASIQASDLKRGGKLLGPANSSVRMPCAGRGDTAEYGVRSRWRVHGGVAGYTLSERARMRRKMGMEFRMTVQDRACASPIWYTPQK